MTWTESDLDAFQTAESEDRADGIAYGPPGGAQPGGHGGTPTTWTPVDLAIVVEGVRTGQIVGPVPTLMTRSDGVSLLYPGEVHSLAGEPESGKGWITLATCTSVIADGGHVLYLDFEDSPASIVTRLLALGADPEAIVDRFVYVRPADPFTPTAFLELVEYRTYALAVIDGVSEAYSLLGLDSYSNPDAATFLTALPRPLGARGAAVLEIDHVVKAKDSRGRYALGAQHKLAGIAVAYSTDIVSAPSRTTAGLTKLKVEKDRHGHVRGHAIDGVIALAHITPIDDGASVTVTLESPDTGGDTVSEFRPTALMEKVSRLIEDEPGANLNAVRRSVQGKSRYVDLALHLLTSEGFVERRQEGQAYRHYSVAPYRRSGDRDPCPEPRPDRDPDTDKRTVTRVPPLTKGDTASHGEHSSTEDHDRDPQDDADADLELERITAKLNDTADEDIPF